MFNLPFPTDSLYKFCFMFGLVLIVFAFYFRDKQLNKYDNHQSYFILDSLSNLKKINEDNYKHNGQLLVHLRKEINSFFYYRNYVWTRSDTSFFFHYNLQNTIKIIPEYRTFLNHKDNGEVKGSDLNDFVDDLQIQINVKHRVEDSNVSGKIAYLQNKINDDSFYYTTLLYVGVLLFITGTISWYFKIQRPNDEMLELQLLEARAKATSKPKPQIKPGRKHYYPQQRK